MPPIVEVGVAFVQHPDDLTRRSLESAECLGEGVDQQLVDPLRFASAPGQTRRDNGVSGGAASLAPADTPRSPSFSAAGEGSVYGTGCPFTPTGRRSSAGPGPPGGPMA